MRMKILLNKTTRPQLRFVEIYSYMPPLLFVNTSMDIEKHKTVYLSDSSNLCFVAT